MIRAITKRELAQAFAIDDPHRTRLAVTIQRGSQRDYIAGFRLVRTHEVWVTEVGGLGVQTISPDSGEPVTWVVDPKSPGEFLWVAEPVEGQAESGGRFAEWAEVRRTECDAERFALLMNSRRRYRDETVIAVAERVAVFVPGRLCPYQSRLFEHWSEAGEPVSVFDKAYRLERSAAEVIRLFRDERRAAEVIRLSRDSRSEEEIIRLVNDWEKHSGEDSKGEK